MDSIARALKCHEVRFRPTAGQRSKSTIIVTQQCTKPFYYLCFNYIRRGRVPPNRAILVYSGGESVRPNGNRKWGWVKESEIMRTRDLHSLWENFLRKLSKYFDPGNPLLRKWLLKESNQIRHSRRRRNRNIAD